MSENEEEYEDYGEQDYSEEDYGEENEEAIEEQFMNITNNAQYFNIILVLGLFLILFSFVYIYGYHGILKFEKNLNYLIAIMFCGFAMIAILVLIIKILGYITDDSMTENEKVNARTGMLTMIVLIIFFKMMALIRYNYSKLFEALNKSLPKDKSLSKKK